MTLHAKSPWRHIFDLIEQGNVYANGDLGVTLGYTPAQLQAMGSMFLPSVMHPDGLAAFAARAPRLATLADGEVDELEYAMRHADGGWRWFISRDVVFRRAADGTPQQLLGTAQDITARKESEAARSQLQNELIVAQDAILSELSTPLIPINDDVLVMPLIGTIDSRRAEQVIDALLHGLERSRARAAILDITGVSVLDTQVANALLQAAQASRLLGVDVVITGMKPEVAQTLVGLGVDLRTLVVRGTLQSGIAWAMERR